MQCIYMQEIGIPCHLYERLCGLALSWLFLHVIHSGLLVHPLIDLDGLCSSVADLEIQKGGFSHWRAKPAR